MKNSNKPVSLNLNFFLKIFEKDLSSTMHKWNESRFIRLKVPSEIVMSGHVLSLFCADEIKSRRENGWYARRSERDGRLSSARIRRGRHASRQRGETRGRTSSLRSAALHRGCWNPPIPAVVLSGVPAKPRPLPMSWCFLLHSPSPGGPLRESWMAAKNVLLPLADSTGSRAKVSRYIPSNTDLITSNLPKFTKDQSARKRSLMWTC